MFYTTKLCFLIIILILVNIYVVVDERTCGPVCDGKTDCSLARNLINSVPSSNGPLPFLLYLSFFSDVHGLTSSFFYVDNLQ